MKKYLIVFLIFLLPLSLWGQAKIYTKDNRLADFPTKTTKVLLAYDEGMNNAIQQAIASRWRLNPFDFCSESQYKKIKDNGNCYFLLIENKDSLQYLTLKNKNLEVLSIPVTETDMEFFIDILQQYVEDSMESAKVAYSGLSHYNKTKAKYASAPTKTVTLQGFGAKRPYSVTYVFDTDTHELYLYKKTNN